MLTKSEAVREKIADNEALGGTQPGYTEHATVSVDWLTITAKSSDMRDLIHDTARGTFQELGSMRMEIKDWRFKGYTGKICEGIRHGTRKDSDIIMLSGLWATEYWMLFAPLAEHCTRVDLAVTCELDKPRPGLTDYYYSRLPDEENRRKLRLPTYTILNNTQGGTTLYVGVRSSSQMGRVYDKGSESKIADPGYIWRYEIEYKDPCADQILDRLLQKVHNPGIAEHMRATVYNWFAVRQVKPIFLNEGEAWLVDTEAKVTSDDVKLQWISTQVKPSVASLMNRGKVEEVIKALGLDQWAEQQRGKFDVS